MKVRSKQKPEMHPKEEIPIDDENRFGLDDHEIENLSDFFYKYFKPFYRLFVHTIPDIFRSIKWTFQRLFRKHHCADRDLWNLAFFMAPSILTKLKAFRTQQEKSGNSYPSYFSEWGYEGCKDKYGGMGMLKEDYEKARAEGKFGGGGLEAWLATINEMIFAFEYHLHDSGHKKQKRNFFEKWNLENPYRETEDNFKWSYCFRKPDGTRMITGEKEFKEIEQLKNEGWIPVNKHRVYLDIDLLNHYSQRAEKGMELFGKFYWDLWD